MDLLPKSDSPDELAGGKTGRQECKEADAGWSRSRGRREDRETGVQGGGRWPEPSLENGGGRWDGRSCWKDGMRDVAGRRASGDDRLPGRKKEPEPEPEKEGSRRKRGCREGDAGRSGSRRRREEIETGPPGGRLWMEPEPEKEGRTQAEDGSAGRRETSRTEDETQAEDAHRRRREEGGLGELSLEDGMGGSENGFRAMGRKEGICASEAHGARHAGSINGLTPVSHQCGEGKNAISRAFESRMHDRAARKTSVNDDADGRMLAYDGRV